MNIKQLANKMKSKGLQKLRWYCQMCEKQCRDGTTHPTPFIPANGFKCHLTTEPHRRQMAVFADKPGRILHKHTKSFMGDFLAMLSSRYVGKRVAANKVYQEYISDKSHMHMNATGFGSLSGLVKHLGKSGICEVDETDKGWYIKYIDRSSDTMRKTEADQKRQRMDKNEAEWEQKLLEEQIKRALEREIVNEEGDLFQDELYLEGEDVNEDVVDEEMDGEVLREVFVVEKVFVAKNVLVRKDDEKIVLNVKTLATSIQKNQIKRINPFKMKSAAAVKTESVKEDKKLTAIDEIIRQETAKKEMAAKRR